MKVFVLIESRDATNPIQQALELIIRTFGNEIIESVDGAEVAFTNSPTRALAMLKASDEVRVIISPMEFPSESVEIAAQSLARAYHGRVVVCDVFATDETGLMPYLTTYLRKEAS